jgi:hypothetical protein
VNKDLKIILALEARKRSGAVAMLLTGSCRAPGTSTACATSWAPSCSSSSSASGS